MTTLTGPHERSARPGWHYVLAQTILFVIAPLISLSSGFFTANFVISGLYSWPRTSRVFALTLTLMILAYEFIYKEQVARSVPADRAWQAVIYSCVVPYSMGILIMLALIRL